MSDFDPRTTANIHTLLPAARVKASEFMTACIDADIPLKIICGTRTYAEQDVLYEQGRTKPGNIITNARGGYSWHNFGIAWDIGIFDLAIGKYIPESPYYRKAGLIGEGIGLEWGGRWKFVDEPHFQLKLGLTLAQCRERVAKRLPVAA